MAVVRLNDNHSRTQFFQKTVLRNLDYWLAWLDQVKEASFELLDNERDNVIKAIFFAFDLGKSVWPTTQQLIITFSPFMERRGYWDVWNDVLRRAVHMAEYVGDELGRVHLSALLARLLFQQSHFDEARHTYRRTIRLARKIGDRFNEARACSNLGYHYAETGQWQRSEVLCCHALEIFEDLGSDHGRAHTHNHLGVLYSRRDEPIKAKEHLGRACTLWQNMGDVHGLMRGFTNLGFLYLDVTNQIDQALFYLGKSLQMAQIIGDEIEVGTIYMNIGFIHILDDNLFSAESHTRQAEAIFRRFANLSKLANVLENLALIYLKRQQGAKAISFMEEALTLRQASNNKQAEIQALIYLADYESAAGNVTKAGKWLQEAENQIQTYQLLNEQHDLQTQVTKLRRSLT